MELKKRILIFGTAAVLIASGYHLYKENNPYNSKNITFINQEFDDFSRKMEDFIENNFKDFERIMINFSKEKYGECSISDITSLEKYLDIILTCNFKNYEPKSYDEREKSGFVINFENYFKKDSNEYNMVKWASEQYQKIIKSTYRYVNPNISEIIKDCGWDYNYNEENIKKLNPFARYIVLKLIRPILDLDSYNDISYSFQRNTRYHVYLGDVDKDIEQCLSYLEQKCSNSTRYR